MVIERWNGRFRWGKRWKEEAGHGKKYKGSAERYKVENMIWREAAKIKKHLTGM